MIKKELLNFTESFLDLDTIIAQLVYERVEPCFIPSKDAVYNLVLFMSTLQGLWVIHSLGITCKISHDRQLPAPEEDPIHLERKWKKGQT